MKRHQHAVHRAIVVVDVEQFTDPDRNNAHLLEIRAAMYGALKGAIAGAGIDWAACTYNDKGDGALVLIPPEVTKDLLVTMLPALLEAALRRHNATCSSETRIRLRVSVHAGEIHYDDHGVAGAAINRACRLVDAAPLRSALAESRGELALIVSEWFYEEVVRHDPEAVPASYQRVEVVVKETRTVGWIRVPRASRPRLLSWLSWRPPRRRRPRRQRQSPPARELLLPAAAVSARVGAR